MQHAGTVLAALERLTAASAAPAPAVGQQSPDEGAATPGSWPADVHDSPRQRRVMC